MSSIRRRWSTRTWQKPAEKNIAVGCRYDTEHFEDEGEDL